MQSEDQTAAIGFLTNLGKAPQRIDTHISTVILFADKVYKLKRAVKLPYVDFSTPLLRLSACATELFLNRRTAPGLYIGVRRITREADGQLAFDGAGELADAVVEMLPFGQDDLFDTMAREGRLTGVLLTRLAHVIAGFHKDAAQDFTRSGSHAVEAALEANEGGFGEARIFDPLKVARLFNLCRARLDQFHRILDARGIAGKVRRVHGDLHLRNICLFKGEPVLFDCLEFSEDLGTTDVLYDLAFLLMDLVHRGLRAQANLVFNRYIDETGDDEAVALMPFFIAIRAAVRAHVGASSAGEDHAKASEARDYLDLALELLGPHQPRLVAVSGLSGSGKSSVAAQIAARVDLAPGARILSTDRIRKQLAGISAEEKLPAEAYTQLSSVRVYAEQRAQATRVLGGGWSVVVDGVFLKPEEREAIEAVASSTHVRFDGLWLEASRDVLASRVAARAGDPSDATVDVLDQQLAQRPGALSWRPVDASASLDESTEKTLQALV